MQAITSIDRPNKRLRCMMMTDDNVDIISPGKARPDTANDKSLALLASVASAAPIQVNVGRTSPPIVLRRDHHHDIMSSTIGTKAYKLKSKPTKKEEAPLQSNKNKIIRKVSLTSIEGTPYVRGVLSAAAEDAGGATGTNNSIHNKKRKKLSDASHHVTAASAAASASASGAAEKIAIKGVSLFLREMKSTNPQDCVGALDTMALCLKTEMDILRRNDYAKTLFAVNGYNIILKVMKQWKDHQELQRAGCNCLCIMTEPQEQELPSPSSSSSEEEKTTTGPASASRTRTNVSTLLAIMEVIIQAMRTFPMSYAIQRNGIATLDNCCDQFFASSAATGSTTTTGTASTRGQNSRRIPVSTTKANKKAQNRFVQLLLHHRHHQRQEGQEFQGGVYLVTKAMKTFSHVLDLQIVGCSFIHTLVSTPTNNKMREECWQALKQHHAMSTVTTAYENHPNSDDIKHHLQNIMDRMLLF